MRQTDVDEPNQALGTPINRKPPPAMAPVPGRPGWFTDAKHREPFYVEPIKPMQTVG